MGTGEEAAKEQLSSIWQAWKDGDIQSAVSACQAMNRDHPRNAEGWSTSSRIILHLGGGSQALQFIDRALELAPARPDWRRHRVRCLLAIGDWRQAHREFDKLAARAEDQANELAELALLAGELKQHEKAAELYERATGLEPGNARLHYNLAATRRFLGDLEAALSSASRALELDPGDADAHYLRSSLKRWKPEENHVDALEAALPLVEGKALAETQVCYALAKELEDCANYEASFGYLERGARLRRDSIQYDLSDDLDFIRALSETYDRDLLAMSRDGYDCDQAIFVLGLPRSGTTLVERIISACDGVTSIGESTLFTRLVGAGAQQVNASPQATRADLVRATRQLPFSRLGEAYIQQARPPDGTSRRFVDKFPQNSLNIGAIHRALPEAKIVLLERHPMDACYAMYKALFTEIYGFSYDLAELARYFVAHDGLMRHWQAALPGKIHRVRYEDLVMDTEQQARSLLAYCELPWQEQCLDFQHNRLASTTASASQVRQGIYTTSVGMWKNYREQLEPLERILRDAGCLDRWED